MKDMYETIQSDNRDTDNKPIYISRFMDFTNFVDLVERKELTLLKPEKWEDPFENYILKSFNNREGLKRIVKILQAMSISDIGSMMFSLCINQNSSYGQSWTYIDESDALWRIYDKNQNHASVRIKVSLDKIQILKEKNLGFDYAPIEYIEKPNLEEDIKKIFSNDSSSIYIFKSMLLKRNSFNHEHEFRLLLSDFGQLDRLRNPEITYIQRKLFKKEVTPNSEEFYDLLMKVNEIYQNEPNFKDISIGNPSDFIDSVLLNPLAPDWVNKTLKEYCKNNKIHYIGKSTLYTFS